jgi:hypothetical protein
MVLSDAMGGCDGFAPGKNAVFGGVCAREGEKLREQERTERSCCSPIARDAELRTAARERRDEERKAERSGTKKERCEYMV